MTLEEILIQKIESLGPIRWTRSFGWIGAHSEDKFFCGYKVIDENYLHILLILSPVDFVKALESGDFEKFEFGKTWVEGEIISEEEIEAVWSFIISAHRFAKVRKKSPKRK